MATTKQKAPYLPPDIFTPAMQDRQARGKDPYGNDDETARREKEARLRLGANVIGECEMAGKPRVVVKDTFRDKELRSEAIAILDNPELLMAQAQAQGDSIAGQRLRFARQLYGFTDDRDEWVPSAWRNANQDRERESGREKEVDMKSGRVSDQSGR